MSRFDRQERFFGAEGQRKLEDARVVVVGVGGIGTHVVQQLAYLGVGRDERGWIGLIDGEEIDETNRNRYVGTWQGDPIPGSAKVALAARHIQLIDPAINVRHSDNKDLRSAKAYELVKASDVAIGCLDTDGARTVFNELCLAYGIPFIDLATDIKPGPDAVYGGRLFSRWHGERGCLVCAGEIDMARATQELASARAREDRRNLYGIDKEHLDGRGPSVVSLNGVIASLGVTELMCALTGLRPPARFINYRGDRSSASPRQVISTGCYYCDTIAGSRDDGGVERYFTMS